MVASTHQLQAGGQVLLVFGLLAIKIQIPELEIRALGVVDGSNDDEAALGRPVDRVVVLLLKSPQVLKAADLVALLKLRAEERD